MICHCVRTGWELRTDDKVLNFESAMIILIVLFSLSSVGMLVLGAQLIMSL